MAAKRKKDPSRTGDGESKGPVRWYSRRAVWLVAVTAAAVLSFLAVPVVEIERPLSLAVFSKDGQLLGATVAADGQWRFGPGERLPAKFVAALVEYEDRRFFSHPGVDPLAVARALVQNLKAGTIVSGASTLTMQLVRLSRPGKPRTIWEKIVEAVLALRLELARSKRQVLEAYAANAPFGANVVGLEAACWRWFGHRCEQLSWAEAATLAVLPNRPSLVHPARRRGDLLRRRNALLDRLAERGKIDAATLKLAKLEPLPRAPRPLPRLAPHLVARLQGQGRRGRVHVTIDAGLQRRATEVLQRHQKRLAGMGIHNLAAVIAEVRTGDVLAYVGNAGDPADPDHGYQVDIVRSPRSTGSTLKPFLYAAMLDAGELMPRQLVADIPTSFSGFAPKNFSRDFLGAVPADEALVRSLNVPAVRLLAEYGVDRFYGLLLRLGLNSIGRFPAGHYGLSLVIGGAESTVWELAGAYRKLALCALESESVTRALHVLAASGKKGGSGEVPLGPGACWLTLEALQGVHRPGVEAAWRNFASARRVGWKTGTSFGFRDAWAVGVDPGHVVAVWAGNADGEGRPGLVGSKAAGPVLFELFGLLPDAGWFPPPYGDLEKRELCARSGMLAGTDCEETVTGFVPRREVKVAPCPHCRTIYCDEGCIHRLHRGCEREGRLRKLNIMVLPPAMEHYYRLKHGDYRPLPPWRRDCAPRGPAGDNPISILYPRPAARVYIPVDLDGRRGKVVFEAAHREPNTTIFWHLDGRYLGRTSGVHQLELAPGAGSHRLLLEDGSGSRLAVSFEVLDKESSWSGR